MLNDAYTPTVLICLSISLCVASCFLVYNVKRYFKRGMKAEACRVQTINIVYTTAYITRAIMSVVEEILDFQPGNEEVDNVNVTPTVRFRIYLCYAIGYLFWDVIPLTLIMSYHYQNFLTETTDSEDSSTSLAESINGSSSSAS